MRSTWLPSAARTSLSASSPLKFITKFPVLTLQVTALLRLLLQMT